jgi:hypothetical protein
VRPRKCNLQAIQARLILCTAQHPDASTQPDWRSLYRSEEQRDEELNRFKRRVGELNIDRYIRDGGQAVPNGAGDPTTDSDLGPAFQYAKCVACYICPALGCGRGYRKGK